MKELKESILHIGFDDTDSLEGSCTTYLATKIIEKIKDQVEFLDFPRLIRNNPNIPWKTRGNGAIALTIKVKEGKDIENIKSKCILALKTNYQKDTQTNPGMVFIQGAVQEFTKQFSIKALTDIISIQQTKKIIRDHNITHYSIGNGRGLTGALAAIGNTLNPSFEDFTYELLTYRKKRNVGTKRQIDQDSVRQMDYDLKPFVFNNIDEETNKSIISPAGKDPVLYGIRGEDPLVLLIAMKKVQIGEEIESYCIFRTNQGTDQHFKYASSHIKNYNVFKGQLSILHEPKTIPGGHVILKGKTENSSKSVDIAAFEPSKTFRRVIKSLQSGDKIIAYGGVRFRKESNSFSIQLEKCEITFLADKFKEEAPFCPRCKKRMVSDGKNKGYKCRHCKYKDKTLTKIKTPIQRVIQKGVYIPPAQAQRHLVKPHRRYGLKKKDKIELIENWWKVF